jgi:hypothetical protein
MGALWYNICPSHIKKKRIIWPGQPDFHHMPFSFSYGVTIQSWDSRVYLLDVLKDILSL